MAKQKESYFNLDFIKINKTIRQIRNQREKILEAFIAETGLKPSKIEQVEERHSDKVVWYVRKRGEE